MLRLAGSGRGGAKPVQRWPVVVVGVLIGTAVGRYHPSILVHLVYGEYGWLASITLGTATLGGGATFAVRQRPTPTD